VHGGAGGPGTPCGRSPAPHGQEMQQNSCVGGWCFLFLLQHWVLNSGPAATRATPQPFVLCVRSTWCRGPAHFALLPGTQTGPTCRIAGITAVCYHGCCFFEMGGFSLTFHWAVVLDRPCLSPESFSPVAWITSVCYQARPAGYMLRIPSPESNSDWLGRLEWLQGPEFKPQCRYKHSNYSLEPWPGERQLGPSPGLSSSETPRLDQGSGGDMAGGGRGEVCVRRHPGHEW
jgi:hypothetical protein